MNMEAISKLKTTTQIRVGVLLLIVVMMMFTLASLPSQANAAECGDWQHNGCCNIFIDPGLEDNYKRQCTNSNGTYYDYWCDWWSSC